MRVKRSSSVIWAAASSTAFGCFAACSRPLRSQFVQVGKGQHVLQPREGACLLDQRQVILPLDEDA